MKCNECGGGFHTHHEIDLDLPNLYLSGHPDMILFVNGVYYIFEFKTVDRNDIAFDDIAEPFADHRLQVSFYYKIMKASGMNVSRRLTIVYLDRSNKKLFAGKIFKSFAIKPEADSELAIFRNRLLHVKQGIDTKKLPPRICPNSKCERSKNCDVVIECFERKNDFLDQVHLRYRPLDAGHGGHASR